MVKIRSRFRVTGGLVNPTADYYKRLSLYTNWPHTKWPHKKDNLYKSTVKGFYSEIFILLFRIINPLQIHCNSLVKFKND